ncbi:hypothetical protein RFI_21897 [Reticulomyxa filosa]|uniref:Uncharacterized protein n=1 Tax=Reticulomyxa filosa TaxID=46433 RepID=X6MP84_RETFI|nr:hypothetical protein RFI_21897 [Reticulomyxa filosa]|eukprot:ETO15466.1 hypothetical protein RFI_21897 [Reticulomyxa filosa]
MMNFILLQSQTAFGLLHNTSTHAINMSIKCLSLTFTYICDMLYMAIDVNTSTTHGDIFKIIGINFVYKIIKKIVRKWLNGLSHCNGIANEKDEGMYRNAESNTDVLIEQRPHKTTKQMWRARDMSKMLDWSTISEVRCPINQYKLVDILPLGQILSSQILSSKVKKDQLIEFNLKKVFISFFFFDNLQLVCYSCIYVYRFETKKIVVQVKAFEIINNVIQYLIVDSGWYWLFMSYLSSSDNCVTQIGLTQQSNIEYCNRLINIYSNLLCLQVNVSIFWKMIECNYIY